MKTGVWWIAIGGLLLACALGVQVWGGKIIRSGGGPRQVPLAAILPMKITGGGVRDEPIAATEEMKKAVSELLNFNEGIFRIYETPAGRVSVYVAWWEAGRMSPRLVATHTPDVCWPENGWVRDPKAESNGAALTQSLLAEGIVGGELRVFRRNGIPEYVIYWHKVGDEILSYKTGYAPPWWAWLDEMRRGGLNLRKEQLFVRVSSDKPLQEILGRPEMGILKQALRNLGLGIGRSRTASDGSP